MAACKSGESKTLLKKYGCHRSEFMTIENYDVQPHDFSDLGNYRIDDYFVENEFAGGNSYLLVKVRSGIAMTFSGDRLTQLGMAAKGWRFYFDYNAALDAKGDKYKGLRLGTVEIRDLELPESE